MNMPIITVDNMHELTSKHNKSNMQDDNSSKSSHTTSSFRQLLEDLSLEQSEQQ
jgi:hypothetical protein